ncbi:MAG: hypothetical protein UU47_C0002G0018 [candidate division TM6 bacterium GW2011_GWE2_41_16]|nr:MAG: hypothetical protein UU47_C0002G0018 [candidate division TM6 bacterium GW2011_GWE2_41_16]
MNSFSSSQGLGPCGLRAAPYPCYQLRKMSTNVNIEAVNMAKIDSIA